MRHLTTLTMTALLLLATTTAATAAGGEQLFSAYYDADDLPRLVVRPDATSIDWRDFDGEVRVYRDRSRRTYTTIPAAPLIAGGEVPIRVPSLAWLEASVLHVELWRTDRDGHSGQETRVRTLDVPLLVPTRPETLIAPPPPCPTCGPGSRDEGPLGRIPARPGLTDAEQSLPGREGAGGSGPGGDLDGDGDTDAADLAALILAWGPCLDRVCSGDLNGDYRIDSEDLFLLLSDLDG